MADEIDINSLQLIVDAADNGHRWVAVEKSVREVEADTRWGAPNAFTGGICNVLGFSGTIGDAAESKRTMNDIAKARAAFIATFDPTMIRVLLNEIDRVKTALDTAP